MSFLKVYIKVFSSNVLKALQLKSMFANGAAIIFIL